MVKEGCEEMETLNGMVRRSIETTGIRIGEKHTFQDWGLLLISITVSSPEAKTKVVEVLGGDGSIDLTEALGPVRYKNRTLVFSLILIDRKPEKWHEVSSLVRNYCHGKKMRVFIDTDPGYYWEGRVSVESDKQDQIHSTIEISLDAFPYKYELTDSQEPWKWDSFNFVSGVIRYVGEVNISSVSNQICIPKGDMLTVPEFYVSEISTSLSVIYGGREYSLRKGKNRFPQIRVGGEEEVILSFKGLGKVKVYYRGGRL